MSGHTLVRAARANPTGLAHPPTMTDSRAKRGLRDPD
jgi:hypothetical protein